MSGPDSTRPELPDPQHDRHVAFPDDGAAGESRAAATPSAGATLPPEAWAPRPVEPSSASSASSASSTSTWQPDVQPGSILRTPPSRPHEPGSRKASGSLGGKLLTALVVVPVMFGFLSTGSHDDYDHTDGSGTGVESPMGDAGPDPVHIRVVDIFDTSTIDGTLLEAQPTVHDVPQETSGLRVEVVGEKGAYIDFDIFADGQLVSGSSRQAPYVEKLFLDERPASLNVTARNSAPDSGTLQCRIYADDILVAVDTGPSDVTCTPHL